MISRRRFFTAAAASLLPGVMLLRATPASKPLRVVYLSDVHAMADFDAPARMSRAAVAINQLEPDLILGGGDFVHGGFQNSAAVMQEHWKLFTAFQKQLRARFEPMIGNHDFVEPIGKDGRPSKADPRRFFLSHFQLKNTFRSFALGGFRFFFLDSVEVTADGSPYPYRGHISDAQLDWLAKELNGIPTSEPLVLLTHIPFRTTFLQAKSGPLEPTTQSLVTGNANDCLTLFRNHNLRIVLQGHLHYNEQIVVNDTNFIMGGALCGQWWRGSNLGTPPGFGSLELETGRWNYSSFEPSKS